MPLTTVVLRELIAAGLQGEALLAAAERIEQGEQATILAKEAAVLAERRAKAAAKKQRQRDRLKRGMSPNVPGDKGDKRGQDEMSPNVPGTSGDSRPAESAMRLKKQPQAPEDTQLCMVEWIEEQIVATENISETDDRMSPNVPGDKGDNGGHEAKRASPTSLPSPSDGAPSPAPHPLLTSHTPASTPPYDSLPCGSERGRASAAEVVEFVEAVDTEPFAEPLPARSVVKVTRLRRHPWPEDFAEQFWKVYPRREGKKDALTVLAKIEAGDSVPFQTLLDGVARYAAKNLEPEYTKLPGPWLRGERWADETGEQHASGSRPKSKFGKGDGAAVLVRKLYSGELDEELGPYARSIYDPIPNCA